MKDETILEEVGDAARDYWASINEPTEISDARIAKRLDNGDLEVTVMWYSDRMEDGDEMVYLAKAKNGEIDLTLIDHP